MVLYTTSLSNWNFMLLNVKPAANTATPELALAMSSKFGSRITGNLMSSNTRMTAKIGAQQTGSFKASITGFDFLPPDGALLPFPWFIKAKPIGIFTAFTTMETMATTKPVVAVAP